MIMTQTITTSTGMSRTFTIKTYSDGKNTYMKYIKPARVKGFKMLFLNDGDEIWIYYKRSGRTRKIASHNKNKSVMGSDFSYEDFSGKGFKQDYKVKLLDEEEHYRLRLIPKKDDASYSKLIVWISKDFLTKRIDYYNKKNDLVKRLRVSDYKKIDGYSTPFKIVMKNLKKGTKTVMEIKEVEYNIKLPSGIFKVDKLSK